MKRTFEGTCSDYTHDGMGIVKNNRKPVFIENIIKGEKVEYIITKSFKDYDLGELVKIIDASNSRVKPICPIFKSCGGCALQHMNYQEQLSFKKNHVKECLAKIAKVNISVEDCLGMEEPYFYRNKIQVPFAMKKGKVDYGFYKKGTHDIVSMKNCFLQEDLVDNILKTIKDVFSKHKLRAYDEDKKEGILRNVLIKRAFSTNETMVVLVTNVENFPKRKEVVKEILKSHKEVKTIVQNINARSTNVILGEKERVLFGKGYIEDVLLGVKYRISAKSFYQVNPVQTEVLYTKAIELAGLNKKDRVIDAYCGIGSISLALAKHVKEVIGVEIVKDAVIDARNNAKYNDIKNANFILDDAAKFMLELSKSGEKIDVVFTDPPRKGCDQVFLDSLLELRPKKIIYISCNPSTLARDLLTLKKDYEINKVLPVDMFPQTHHVECVVLLQRTIM